MTENAKIIASSILVAASTIGLTITPLGENNSVLVPLIIGFIGCVLLVNAWTGNSLRTHFKKLVAWTKDYDNLENRIIEDKHEDTPEPKTTKQS